MSEIGRRALEGAKQALEVEGYVIATPGPARGPKRWSARLRPDPDPWLALYQLRCFRTDLEAHTALLVQACRVLGYDWGSIATAVGTSEPTIRRRYGWVDDDPATMEQTVELARQQAERARAMQAEARRLKLVP